MLSTVRSTSTSSYGTYGASAPSTPVKTGTPAAKTETRKAESVTVKTTKPQTQPVPNADGGGGAVAAILSIFLALAGYMIAMLAMGGSTSKESKFEN